MNRYFYIALAIVAVSGQLTLYVGKTPGEQPLLSVVGGVLAAIAVFVAYVGGERGERKSWLSDTPEPGRSVRVVVRS